MILIISAQQSMIDGLISDRFGRCPWLITFDTNTKHWEAFPNPGVEQRGGAGVAAAQFAIDHKAGAVISGSFGPNASAALKAANVAMYVFSDGIQSVQQAVSGFLEGKLAQFQ